MKHLAERLQIDYKPHDFTNIVAITALMAGVVGIGNFILIPEVVNLLSMEVSSVPDFSQLSQLSGTALTIGVLLFMVHYFMKREERRENFITEVIGKNTEALIQLKEILKSGK